MGHKLTQITFGNFKSIVAETFELADYTPLVGYNNAGKSNILSGIKWLLRRSSLGEECFHNPGAPIVVDGLISGIDAALLAAITPAQRASIQPFIVNEELRVRRIQNNPNDKVADIKLYVFNHVAADPADPWVPNPNGIDNAMNALFPEPIQIGAMENAEEDISKSKTTTTIGKLIAEIIGPVEAAYGANVQMALQGLKDILDAEGQHRAPELDLFDTTVNQKIETFFPDVRIKLHVPTPELKEVFGKGTIRVYDHAHAIGRDISTLGHGAQRSIQMALIRHLAELKQAAQIHTTTTLLLIDEPELYLHPQAVEVVREALKKLSEEGYQVVFSTHSPLMITHKDIGNSVLIRKTHPRGTHMRRTLKSAIPQVEHDAPSQIQLLFSLSHSANILFSERVILTEGATEHRILPKIFEKIKGRSMGIFKYALVKQDGVANTRKCMAVLNVMDLPTKAIVDLDYVFRNAENDGVIGANDPDIAICKQNIARLATSHDFILAADGWPRKGGNLTAAQAFAVLGADQQSVAAIANLHAKLLASNIWVWRRGAIEEHLGLQGKSEAHWAVFCGSLDINPLAVAATDPAELTACIDWLIA